MNLGQTHDRVTNPSQGSTAAYISVAAGDVFRLSPNAPIRIVRWGFICTTTVNDATNALKLTGDIRVTAGTDTGRVTGATTVVASQQGYNASNLPAFNTDAAGGSLTLVASASQVAAGKGVYHDLNPQTGSGSPLLYPQPDTAFVSPGGVDTQLVVYPGQEFLIKSQATAPAAGAGIFFVEFEALGFQGTGYAQLAQIVPASISPTPSNSLANLTRVQS